jgi:uncharacterized protein (DUF2132 family)
LDNKQLNNPLHGIKLSEIVEYLYNEYGWEKLGKKIKINSFTKDPSIKSSLKFLRKTDWARKEVEDLYLWNLRKNAKKRSNKPFKKAPIKESVESKHEKVEGIEKVEKVEKKVKLEKIEVPKVKAKAKKFSRR